MRTPTIVANWLIYNTKEKSLLHLARILDLYTKQPSNTVRGIFIFLHFLFLYDWIWKNMNLIEYDLPGKIK